MTIDANEVTPDMTYVEHWKSLNGKRVKDKEVVNTSAINISFTFDEMNQRNLRRFLLGTDSTASKFSVLDNTLEEGSGQLVIETDIGQDLVFRFPKATLRPDGALNFDPESWHEMSMTLNILEYISGDYTNINGTYQASINATWLAKPFGEVDTSDI